jgi:serine O-acetyltransferase
VEAVLADTKTTAAHRGDRHRFHSRLDAAVQALRLAIVSDSFLAQVCYRAKAACQARRISVIPRVFHRLAVMFGQVAIGDPVVMQPGVYLPHGQVVVDGMVDVGSDVALLPFVTIGLRAGSVQGPTIGPGATIGTGAKVLGPVRVGVEARVGANAVVISDVADGSVVVGVPARPLPVGARVRPLHDGADLLASIQEAREHPEQLIPWDTDEDLPEVPQD